MQNAAAENATNVSDTMHTERPREPRQFDTADGRDDGGQRHGGDRRQAPHGAADDDNERRAHSGRG